MGRSLEVGVVRRARRLERRRRGPESDVAAWLRDLGLERYAQAFLDAEVAREALPELTGADLRELGLPLGPRKVVLKAVRGLAGPAACRAPPAHGAVRRPRGLGGALRQARSRGDARSPPRLPERRRRGGGPPQGRRREVDGRRRARLLRSAQGARGRSRARCPSRARDRRGRHPAHHARREGRVVPLAGGRGIGKSRLVGALRERLAQEPRTR